MVQVERDLKALFPESSWADLHLQIIFFGRQHCPAVRHVAANCPICRWAGVEDARVMIAPGSAVKALPSTPRVATPAKRARKSPGKGAARALPTTP